MASTARIGDLVRVDVVGFHGPVHVRIDGPESAPPLLLLHGFSGSMHWLAGVVPELTNDFRVVRVDLLGHGDTGGPAADAPLQARAVDAVLERLALTGVTAVGHSFGADVAVELAETSERVDRLVIVTQAPDYSDANLPRGRGLMTVRGLSVAIHRFAQSLSVAVHAATRSRRAPAGRALAEQAVRDFRALNTAMFKVVLVDRRDRMARRPLDAQVRAAGKPTLVVLGGKDHFYGDRSAARYRAAGARVEVLPESGHSPLLEFPERMVELLRGFLVTA